MLTAEVFSLHLRLVALAVRGRSASAARPDRSASPGDESDAEVEGGPVHETDTAHRALLEDRSGLGWVVRATRCGRQLRFHDGFLDEGGSGRAKHAFGLAEESCGRERCGREMTHERVNTG